MSSTYAKVTKLMAGPCKAKPRLSFTDSDLTIDQDRITEDG
jgi:hypothetical protein